MSAIVAAGRSLVSSWMLKAGVSALLLALILSLVPVAAIWTAFQSLPLWLWGTVLVSFMLGHMIAATKWWLLAVRPGGLPLKSALGPHVAGLVANLCLPGVAGGDVVRAGLVMRRVDDKAPVLVGSLGDRISDSLALLILGLLGALVCFGAPALVAGPLPWFLLAGLAVLVGAGLFMLVPSRLRAGRLATKVSVALRRLARRPALLVLCLSLSILVQTLFVGLNVALARGCGLDLPVAAWLFAWPLAKLIAIVPISLAGLGVREASLVGLMAPFGADSATVVAVGLLWQSILFATGAIGGLVLLLTSGPRGAGAPPVAAVERLRSRP